MAQMHGTAGEWARVKGTLLGLWPVFASVFASGFAAAMTFFGFPVSGVAIFVVSLGLFAFLVLKWVRLIERYFTGARGEEKVANILSSLSNDCHIFNDFMVGRRQIDHVIVGPAGVFVVETKFWRGRVTIEDGQILVDGFKPSRPPLEQVLKETKLVKDALAKLGWSGSVTPLLVYASDTFALKCAELSGAVIMNSCEIAGSFAANRVVMAPSEVGRLVALMENNI